jgi:hypothetical protein
MAATYTLTVDYSEPNPDYKPPRRWAADFHGYKPEDPELPPFVNARTLSVVLTEAEWLRVKEAVLREFK